jgi:NADH dehydrogenase FAD-containing subunit
MSILKRVVMIGAGFAGLKAVENLSEYDFRFEVTVVDKNDYAILKPKLTSIATGDDVENIKILVPPILREHKVAWSPGEVTKIDKQEKIVYLDDNSKLKYDYLIISSGVQEEFLDLDTTKFYSFSNYDNALKLKERVESFNKEDEINIVILENPINENSAIEFAFLLQNKLNKSHKINLITQNNTLLPDIGEKSREFVLKELQNKEINIVTNASLDDIKSKYLDSTSLNVVIPTYKMPQFIENSNINSSKYGIKTDEFMEYEDNIYIIGDINALSTPKLAHNAFKEADISTNNILVKENLEDKKLSFTNDILLVIETDKLEAILVYSDIKYGGNIDYATKSILAKALKVVFKNSLYFSLGEVSDELDDTVKKLIKKYAK